MGGERRRDRDKTTRSSSSASLEQDALDKLRNDRSDLHLHVPLLSRDPRMHRHVLHRKLNLDGQAPKLQHLAQAEPDRNRPDVFRRRGPVSQDVTRVTDAPALTKEKRGDRLQVSSGSYWAGHARRR